MKDSASSMPERIPPAANTAADIYQVQPYYQRFNQKFNMTRQPVWEPSSIRDTDDRRQNLRKLILSKQDGYNVEDWALYLGATANMDNSGFDINWPNRKGNSWQPLQKSGQRLGLGVSLPHREFGPVKADPANLSQMVRRVARLYGADDVGICRLDRRWVYSHWFDEATKKEYPIKFSDEPGYEAYTTPTELPDFTQVIPASAQYAIVLIYEMDREGMATAPTLTQAATTLITYSRISFTTVMMAEFVRGLGYSAIPSSNCTALSVPLAIDAGLGELGRNAKLIHPRFGPRCRISKVITDLPVAVGEPRLWGVTEFCNTCRKCARSCPAGAIPDGDRSFEPAGDFNHHGVLQWQLDHRKCSQFWAKAGTNCGICIRVCPFNKPAGQLHEAARWFVRRKNSGIDSFMTRMDDAMGYGRYSPARNFWQRV